MQLVGSFRLAMKEISFLPGERIIKEGDDGDCHCWNCLFFPCCIFSKLCKRCIFLIPLELGVQDFLCLIEEGNPECKKLIDGEEKAVVLGAWILPGFGSGLRTSKDDCGKGVSSGRKHLRG